MDLNTYLKDNYKYFFYDQLYERMPKYLSSKHRVHRMFIKNCDEPISKYESCIEDQNW